MQTAVLGMLAAGPSLAQESPDLAKQSHPLPPLEIREQSGWGFKIDSSSDPRFTASLLDTPKSVSVIPQDLIRSTGANSLEEALRTLPGITFGAGEGGNPLGDRPFLRGYDSQGSTFVDGMRDIGATTREIFNIEQVEVVKGANGTMDGRGSPGGSLNLVSKTPHLGNAAEGAVGFGTSAYKRFTVDGNYQFADHAAFRLNFMAHGNDVAGRRGVDAARWGIAPSMVFGLGTPTRFSIAYYHIDTNDTPDSGIPYLYTLSNAPRGVGTLYPAKVDRNNFYGLRNRDFNKNSTDMGTIKFEHDFSDSLTVRNMTRLTRTTQDYLWTQPDGSSGNVVNGLVWRRANSRMSEITSAANQTDLFGSFSTGGIKHRFTVGTAFSRESAFSDGYTVAAANGAICRTAGSGPASAYNCTSLFSPNPDDSWAGSVTRRNDPSHSRTLTAAAYAFNTIELSKQLELNMGLRVDRYATRFIGSRSSGAKQTSRNDTLFNYQGGIVYKPVSNASIYASYATSSTPAGAMLAQGSETQSLTPGRGGVGANAAQLGPERNRTIEIGSKWDVLGKKLSLTGALFQIDTSNARVLTPDNTYAMAGNKRVQGLELGIAGKLTRQWQVFGGYTYLKSQSRENGADTALNGRSFPNTPRNSVSLWSTYDITPALTLGGGAFYMSKVYGDLANRRAVPAYWRFDASAAYRINKRLDVQLNVLNMFNKTYFSQAQRTHFATMAPGRSAFITLRAYY